MATLLISSATDDQEGAGDFDGDNIPNFLDTDADGDGMLDIFEGTVDSDNAGASAQPFHAERGTSNRLFLP